MTTTDSHHAEYLAAVAGMQETYGSPSCGRTRINDAGQLVTTWTVGDWVTARLPDGSQRLVCVIEVLTEDGDDSEYHVACHVPGHGRQHWAIKARDVLFF